MTVKEIAFKCTKVGAYFSLGGIRLYDEYDNIYPIKFSIKNSLTSNNFYIMGKDITGTVSTKTVMELTILLIPLSILISQSLLIILM